MNNLKKSFQSYDFKKTENLKEIVSKIRKDEASFSDYSVKKETNMKKILPTIALAFALVIMMLWIFPPLFSPTSSKVVAASVFVEINPSFELSVDQTGEVLSATALNEDASLFELDTIIGLGFSEAIDMIVAWAQLNGLIDITDLDDDYVLVTTVLADESSTEIFETLSQQLQQRLQKSIHLQEMSVVEIKATLVDLFNAQGKDVPIGLYVLNGLVLLEDDTFVSAKEFFSNAEHLEALRNQNQVQINGISETKLRERIETALNKMENAGEDTLELKTRLENASSNQLNQIRKEIQAKENAPENPNIPTNPPGKDDNQDPGANQPNEPGKPDSPGNSNSNRP